jgi:hypothetical protein
MGDRTAFLSYRQAHPPDDPAPTFGKQGHLPPSRFRRGQVRCVIPLPVVRANARCYSKPVRHGDRFSYGDSGVARSRVQAWSEHMKSLHVEFRRHRPPDDSGHKDVEMTIREAMQVATYQIFGKNFLASGLASSAKRLRRRREYVTIFPLNTRNLLCCRLTRRQYPCLWTVDGQVLHYISHYDIVI